MKVKRWLLILMWGFVATTGWTAAETWTFETRTDSFGKDALLDLRFLNEKVAGESGWMYAKDGKLYIPGKKEPFRGWAAGLRPFGFDYSMSNLQYTARAYAKLGINQVREMSDANASILPTPGPDITKVNAEGLAKLHRLVTAMKAEGIYVTWCPWWFLVVKDSPQYPGFAKAESFYWSKDLQDLAKGWYRQLLTTKNPYTGIPLAQDPALNIVELQNEQNLLFALHPSCCDEARWRDLCRQFTEFVKQRHGGAVEKAVTDWKLSAEERGQFVEGQGEQAVLQIPGIGAILWRATRETTPGLVGYGTDFIEFVVFLERQWNSEVARFIKQDLGYKGLILGGDWFAFGAPRFNDLARWGTLPPEGDCIGYHQYSSFFHVNVKDARRASHAVGAGDYYCDGSVLATPRYLPTSYKRMKNVPMICTEIGLPTPNRYSLEGQLAAAAYGSLQDFDQISWLQVEWMGYGRGLRGGYNKFNHNWPHLLGQFPGAALLFRSGFVKEGPVVVSYRKPVADYVKSPPPILDVWSGDPLYRRAGQKDASDDPAGKPVDVPDAVDPLAFQVGAVEYQIGEPAEQQVDKDALAKNIDRAKKVVRSATGQLVLDYGRQLLTINTPQAQGATGLLGQAGKIDLGDVVIQCGNDPSAVLVIALDNKPLKESGKILIQAVTESTLTGWQTARIQPGTKLEIPSHDKKSQTITLPDCTQKIEATGKPPFQIERIRATVTFKRRSGLKATAVDLYGYPQTGLTGKVNGSAVTLPENTYFTIIQ